MMTVTPWKLVSWDIKLLGALHVATLRRWQTAGHIMMSHDVNIAVRAACYFVRPL